MAEIINHIPLPPDGAAARDDNPGHGPAVETLLCETCEALRVQLGLAKNRINELEELASEREKKFAAINMDNAKLITRCRELQEQHDAGAASNLAIVRRQVRELLTQLGG